MKIICKPFSRSSIVLFFVLTLVWSDGIWILLNPNLQQYFQYNLSLNWAWLGLAGPGFGALLMAFTINGILGIKQLFAPLLRFRVPFYYYLFIYVGVFLFDCAASWVTALLHPPLYITGFASLLETVHAPFFGWTGIGIFIQMTVIYTLCEELGWRGFALPALTHYMNAAYASLLIGVVWTLWHIPLIYLYGSYFTPLTLMIYTFSIITSTVAYSWLYFKTGKSLLMPGLLHGALNGFAGYFPLMASSIGQGPNLSTVVLQIIITSAMIPYLFSILPIKKH